MAIARGAARAGALLLALGVLAACASAGSESSAQGSTTSASQQQGPLDQAYDFQAHRGGRDSRPENTLYSYQYALEQGATTIECDMQMTKDGVLVMSHEPVLDPAIASDSQGNRVAEGEHAISRMTLDEVRDKELDPAIETVALCNEQESWGVPEGTTLWLDREEPSPWLAGLDIKDFDGDPVQAAHSLGIDDISPYFTEVTPEMVEEAHDLGMKVIPWTVNEMADMETVYRMGVDGIITDRVWTAREFLESQGENLLPRAEVDAPYHLEPDHL